jgi:hypothetical protein
MSFHMFSSANRQNKGAHGHGQIMDFAVLTRLHLYQVIFGQFLARDRVLAIVVPQVFEDQIALVDMSGLFGDNRIDGRDSRDWIITK